MLARVERNVPKDGITRKVDLKVHERANLYFRDGRGSLSGPRHGYITDFKIVDVSSPYTGATYDLGMRVYTFTGFAEVLRLEYWNIKWLREDREQAASSDAAVGAPADGAGSTE